MREVDLVQRKSELGDKGRDRKRPKRKRRGGKGPGEVRVEGADLTPKSLRASLLQREEVFVKVVANLPVSFLRKIYRIQERLYPTLANGEWVLEPPEALYLNIHDLGKIPLPAVEAIRWAIKSEAGRLAALEATFGELNLRQEDRQTLLFAPASDSTGALTDFVNRLGQRLEGLGFTLEEGDPSLPLAKKVQPEDGEIQRLLEGLQSIPGLQAGSCPIHEIAILATDGDKVSQIMARFRITASEGRVLHEQ